MTTPEHSHDKVKQLVHKFKALSPAARRQMNEDATRQGYILPLFGALGWNIEDINEVSPEERVSRGWVDFAFRLGGIPRFFLETKKASEDLNDPRWVKQAIDYAWHKSVTWALLSDFEGLRVFNAEWQEADPFRAEFIAFTVDSYLSDFEKLWWLSRPEAAAGTLDREAEKVGRKIRRVPVTQNLFDDLKQWRNDLNTHLRQYNPMWSAADVDQSVLRILNRLIFVRTAEDREVEPRRLEPLVRELGDARKLNELPRRLALLFREMDAVYDSELFAPHLSETLDCEPAPFERLIKGLYARNYTRYNFNAIDADVLGTVYEQYLGHVVAEPASELTRRSKKPSQARLLGGDALTVVEKRQKRKSQGIYYTPIFVVKYIVQNTLGRYLDEHGYNPSRPVRVLDMACGSGSFLIEAFDALDRHVAQLRGQSRATHLQGASHVFDHARAVELLTQCLYGVDKDKQAVEVARLNLMLRGLHSRDKLPHLDNLRVGDSLISGAPEELLAAFGKDWKAKQPFNWEQEFPGVFTPTHAFGSPSPDVQRRERGPGGEGGFDVIVGNPPYVRQETLGPEFKAFAQKKFTTYTGTADLYIYFIEQAHRLLKPGGYFGMICSNKFMRSNYGKALREFLVAQTTLLEIVDFGELPVFGDAATFPAIIITRKQPAEKQNFLYAVIKRLDFLSLHDEVRSVGTQLDESALRGDRWSLTEAREQGILEKMRAMGVPLGEYVDNKIYRGVVTGYNEAFVINRTTRDKLIADDPKSAEIIKPFVVGDDVRKYRINFQDNYLILTRRGVKIKDYPAVRKHLSRFKERLMPKPDDWKGGEWQGRKPGSYHWYEIQDTVDYYAEFERPKIVYPDIAKESRVAFDDQGLFFGNTVYFIPHNDFYLLGLLNSKLIFTFFKRVASVLGDPDKGGRLRWFRQDVLKIPIRRINFDDPGEKAQHDHIAALVTEMLELQKERAEAERALDDRRHRLAKRIEELDRTIDAAVYKLYGLTEEEIGVVEGKE